MKMNFEEVLQGQETEDRKATQKTGNSTNTIDFSGVLYLFYNPNVINLKMTSTVCCHIQSSCTHSYTMLLLLMMITVHICSNDHNQITVMSPLWYTTTKLNCN